MVCCACRDESTALQPAHILFGCGGFAKLFWATVMLVELFGNIYGSWCLEEDAILCEDYRVTQASILAKDFVTLLKMDPTRAPAEEFEMMKVVITDYWTYMILGIVLGSIAFFYLVAGVLGCCLSNSRLSQSTCTVWLYAFFALLPDFFMLTGLFYFYGFMVANDKAEEIDFLAYTFIICFVLGMLVQAIGYVIVPLSMYMQLYPGGELPVDENDFCFAPDDAFGSLRIDSLADMTDPYEGYFSIEDSAMLQKKARILFCCGGCVKLFWACVALCELAGDIYGSWCMEDTAENGTCEDIRLKQADFVVNDMVTLLRVNPSWASAEEYEALKVLIVDPLNYLILGILLFTIAFCYLVAGALGCYLASARLVESMTIVWVYAIFAILPDLIMFPGLAYFTSYSEMYITNDEGASIVSYGFSVTFVICCIVQSLGYVVVPTCFTTLLHPEFDAEEAESDCSDLEESG